ncbi:TIR domain-containing protein [Fretibacterium fastidiosum]|uniref:TIR domain-containing protein n=1 Tax=Fretibacterium fastidiosum TaxID=651822 RepID=UPI001AD82DBA|nr:TIR domain-containing protein [Fretibacterium fastidiosum]
MKTDEALEILKAQGLMLEEQKRLTNGTGDQLRFKTGEIVNIFNKGTFSVQGKNKPRIEKILWDATGTAQTTPIAPSREVFVVYGHDTTARTQLEAMLRRWDIEPLILDQLPSEGQTIIEKLENYTQQAHYAIVLTTPDDEGHPTNKPGEKRYRARQNVVLELGMLLAKLGRSKVAILIKDQENMEKPSDINGLMYISFRDNVEDGKLNLFKELCAAGFNIDSKKL